MSIYVGPSLSLSVGWGLSLPHTTVDPVPLRCEHFCKKQKWGKENGSTAILHCSLPTANSVDSIDMVGNSNFKVARSQAVHARTRKDWSEFRHEHIWNLHDKTGWSTPSTLELRMSFHNRKERRSTQFIRGMDLHSLLLNSFLSSLWGAFWGMFRKHRKTSKLYNGKSFAWVHIHSIGAEQVWSSSIRLLALAWSQSYVTTPLVDGLELIERRSRSPQLPRFVQEKASLSAPKIPRSLTHGLTQLLKSWLKQWRESLKAIS